jgi:hypothetical protein
VSEANVKPAQAGGRSQNKGIETQPIRHAQRFHQVPEMP